MESETVAFDQAMLKILLIEFMRSTNTPMKLANDQKFRAIFKFLRPDLIMPTSEELLDLNALEHQKFAAWGRIRSDVNDGLGNERLKMAVKYSSPDAPSLQSSAVYKGISLSSILAATSPSTSKEKFPKEIPEKISLISEPMSAPEVVADGEKRSLAELNALFAPGPALSRKRKMADAVCACVVCQLKDPTKRTISKSLTKNSGLITIFLCVSEGVYGMETASELAKNSKFVCCEEHFKQLLENAQHHFDVVDPAIDVRSDNPKIVEAYHVVNKIKGFKDLPSNRKKHILIFVNYVSAFFQFLEKRDQLVDG